MKNKYDWTEIAEQAELSALPVQMLHTICDYANNAHKKFDPAFDALLADLNAWLENKRR